MKVGLLSSKGVAVADVHPWQDVYQAVVLSMRDVPKRPVQPRQYVRASVNFFVEVENHEQTQTLQGETT